MKVAVLMSTYNGEKYIAEQIDSILNQKGDFTLDLIVRDDGSKDGTLDVLENYQNKGLLKWYTGENLGPTMSFLHLINQLAGYDYYAFSDQDDLWFPDKIQRAVSRLGKINKPALYFSNAVLVDNSLQGLGRNVYSQEPRTDLETIACAGGVLGCTIVFNNSLANYLQSYPLPKWAVMHDFYLALLCKSLGGEIIYDQDSTMKYRQHDSNVVGVSYGKLGTIIGRVKDITYKEPVGIAKQAAEIIRIYGNVLPKHSIDWLKIIQNYNSSFINQTKLAFSKRTKYINRNMGLKMRLSIILGHR